MRNSFITALFFLLPSFLFAQKEIEDIIREGIQLHDAGKYQEAIVQYEKALAIDEKNPMALFEIGYAYYALKDYDSAIKYSDKVIKINNGNLVEAFNLKGNTLDDIGKSDKAIKVYEQGLKQFPDNYLLHFNLALSHYRLSHLEETEKGFINTIEIKSSHTSSHYYLGILNYERDKRIPSLLSLYFFLLLEPTGERAKNALKVLNVQMNSGAKETGEKDISVNLSLNQLDGEFSTAEMMLSLSAATNINEKKEGKTEEELFFNSTEGLISILKESSEGKSGFYWDFYVGFFIKIKDAGHLETFCYYVSQSKGEKIDKWLEANKDKLDAFNKWFEE